MNNKRNAWSLAEQGLVLVLAGSLVAGLMGCDSLRFAPSEVEKANAYLHHRTVQAGALQARDEESSPTLQSLMRQATKQSEAMVAYFGLPGELPEAESVESLVGEASAAVTQAAYAVSVQRPDPWDVADHLLEFGVALAGICGGVLGTRAAGVLQTARKQSQALREIVQGNELFKQQNPDSSTAFKQAQSQQSGQTRQIVAELK